MKILCLYNNPCAIELFEWIKEQGHEVIMNDGQLDIDWCRMQKFDLTVSYTYRYILSQEILDVLSHNVVNLHTSYLPWNRGADPNLWSIMDNTPRGVTLHYMDVMLDHGDIIAQSLVGKANEEDTLKTTYDQLDRKAKNLFKTAFEYYEFWPLMKKTGIYEGNYHNINDAKIIKSNMLSYNIKICEMKKEKI